MTQYSQSVQEALGHARDAASLNGSRVIESEHILYGVACVDSEFAGFDAAEMRGTLADMKKSGFLGAADIPLGDAAERVMDYAAANAQSLGAEVIAPQHVMFGIMQERNPIAALPRAPLSSEENEIASLVSVIGSRRSWSFDKLCEKLDVTLGLRPPLRGEPLSQGPTSVSSATSTGSRPGLGS